MNAITICGYLWLAWCAIWLICAIQSKETLHRESLASRLSYTVFVIAAVWLMFYDPRLGDWLHARIVPSTQPLQWFAVAATAAGFAFTLWARAILGGNWSGNVTIKVGHELVRTGPYRWVRHPIYTGLIVAMAGTALALDQWRGLIALVLLWISFTAKRLKKEQFMRQTFGAQYDDYRRTTGAIFPIPRRNP